MFSKSYCLQSSKLHTGKLTKDLAGPGLAMARVKWPPQDLTGDKGLAADQTQRQAYLTASMTFGWETHLDSGNPYKKGMSGIHNKILLSFFPFSFPLVSCECFPWTKLPEGQKWWWMWASGGVGVGFEGQVYIVKHREYIGIIHNYKFMIITPTEPWKYFRFLSLWLFISYFKTSIFFRTPHSTLCPISPLANDLVSSYSEKTKATRTLSTSMLQTYKTPPLHLSSCYHRWAISPV